MAGHPFWGLPGLQQALGCPGSPTVGSQVLAPVAAAAGPAPHDAHKAAATEAVLAQLRGALEDQQHLLDAALHRAERAERQLAEQRGAAEAASAASQRAAEAREGAAHDAAAQTDALTASIGELSDRVAALQEQLGGAEGRAAAAQRELRHVRERAAAAEAQVQQLQQQLYGAGRSYGGWCWGSETVRGNHTPPPPPPLPTPGQQGSKAPAGWQPPPPPEPPPSAPRHHPSSSGDSDSWQSAVGPRQQQPNQQGHGRSPPPSLSLPQQQGGQHAGGPPPERQPSRHLWVGNLPSSLSDSSGPWLLWQEFVPFGPIESVYVGRHPSREGLGYAIVNFSAPSSATAAMHALDDRAVPRLAGSAPLVLRYAAPPKSSSRGASAPTTPRATAGPPLRGPPSTMRHACSEPSLPHPPAPQQPPPPLPYSAAQAQQAQPLPLPLRLPSSTPQPGSAPMATAADRGAATPSSASSNASSASSAAAWHLAVKLPGPEELHAVEEEEGDEAPADPTQPAVREGVADLPLLRPSARPFEPQQGQACG